MDQLFNTSWRSWNVGGDLPTRKWNTRASTKVAISSQNQNFRHLSTSFLTPLIRAACTGQLDRPSAPLSINSPVFRLVSLDGFTPASNRSPTAGSRGFRRPSPLLLSRIRSQLGLATYRQSDFFSSIERVTSSIGSFPNGYEKSRWWETKMSERTGRWLLM